MSSFRLRRVAGAVVLVASGVLSLTACQARTGAAAFVGSHRISESQVVSYLKPGAVGGSSGQAPRDTVVTSLISAQLFRAFLATTPKGVPSGAELAASRDIAFSTVTGNQTAPADADVVSAVESAGLDASYVPVLLEQFELEYAVISRAPGSSASGTVSSVAELAAAVSKTAPKVTLSPRYGSWDTKSLQVSGVTNTTLPPFLSTTALPGPAAQ